MVLINGDVATYPQMSSGGARSPGRGRELSAQGIREFWRVKAVRICDPGS
jgi:acyl-CoA reductase-like NAD-dependent aldehyde dehydrogenase